MARMVHNAMVGVRSKVLMRISIIMPPTSKKLEGHVASGSFVCLSVHPCVTHLDA